MTPPNRRSSTSSSTTMSSTAKQTSSSGNPVSHSSNPLGDIINQKTGSRISTPLSTLVNLFSTFPPRKLGLGFISESIICKLVQLLKSHCHKKIDQSKKPPNPITKSKVIVPYEDTDFFDAESDFFEDIDSINLDDPHLCCAFARDIYEHLHSSEVKKGPAIDYMERVQSNINATMRTILIDWLVEVAEEYSLSPETLYLAVNYIDRYLSGNVITKVNFQLLGVTCMMISAKYEGGVRVPKPEVEDFRYITDNTYSRNEILEMEFSVLNYLKFELTTPTANCFLSRFVLAAAQGEGEVVSSSLLFESVASYLSELSLLDYTMLRYAPSLVAASAVFLAQYVLHPERKPYWSCTLEHYTRYRAKDLEACVKDLLRLCHESPSSADGTAVRKKYSQEKYECAAKMFYPTSLPQELFL